jgi:hypothetical protein
MIFNPSNYPTVFLSYDEPNCEENYNHLVNICPNYVYRVHGVKGSDRAHKMVANLVKDIATNVIIVDGDNVVNRDFYQSTIELKDDIDMSTCVLSYSAKNVINGTQYGNGGIKVWPIELILNMRTHENSNDIRTKTDFALDNYLELNQVASRVVINTSPLQAFRAGFREGIKLCLNNGEFNQKLTEIDWRNYDRLWHWMHVGMDEYNGIFAILGARYAVASLFNADKYDFTQINDFDHLSNKFSELKRNNQLMQCNTYGALIRLCTGDDRISTPLSTVDSARHKRMVTPILRSPEKFLRKSVKNQYDIAYIGVDESTYNQLTKRFPEVISTTFINLIEDCKTDYVFVVEDNQLITEDFDFNYVVDFYSKDKVRSFRCINNDGTVDDNHGVKLIPRSSVYHYIHSHSITTYKNKYKELCNEYEVLMDISNTYKEI